MKIIQTSHDLSYLKDITDMTPELKILLSIILKMEFEIQSRKKSLLEIVVDGKYSDIKDKVVIIQYLEHHQILKDLKKEFWKLADAKTLNTIVDTKPFKSSSTWEPEVLVPDYVLPKFYSYGEDAVSKADPKAEAARKRGAKVI